MGNRSNTAYLTLLSLFLTTHLFASSLETGDLIFRQAQGIFSDIARNFSPHDKRFSHVGIIYITKGRPYVVHSIQEKEKGFNGVVKEPLERFLDEAIEYRLFSLPFTVEEKKHLTTTLETLLNSKIAFDEDFSLQSTQALYCTELVWSVLKEVYGKDTVPTRTIVQDKVFLSIEDILHTQGLKEISR